MQLSFDHNFKKWKIFHSVKLTAASKMYILRYFTFVVLIYLQYEESLEILGSETITDSSTKQAQGINSREELSLQLLRTFFFCCYCFFLLFRNGKELLWLVLNLNEQFNGSVGFCKC